MSQQTDRSQGTQKVSDKVINALIDFGFSVKNIVNPPKSNQEIAKDALEKTIQDFPQVKCHIAYEPKAIEPN